MNNIVNLFTPQTASDAHIGNRLATLEQLHESGLFFDVLECPNYTVVDGEQIDTGRKTIVNADNNRPLSVMAKSYHTVKNETIFTEMDRVLASSDADLTDAHTRVQIDRHGAACMVEYILPAHSIEVSKGDTCCLSITCLNSYDGSGSFKVYVGFYRFKCLNGMVLGTDIGIYRAKHSAKLSVHKAGQVVGTGLQVWLENKDKLIEQSHTLVDEQTVFKALAELSGFTDWAIADNYTQWHQYIRPTMKRQPVLERYMALWNDYKAEMGSTQWALNNTLTHISTHGMQKTQASVQYRMGKENKVGKILEKYGMALVAQSYWLTYKGIWFHIPFFMAIVNGNPDSQS